MNKNFFLAGFMVLQKMYGAIEEEVIEFYWILLKGYSDEDGQKMFENITKTFIPTTQVKFPLPPHFIEAIEGKLKDRSILALIELKKAISSHGRYKSVSFGDGAIHEAVMQLGGWPFICSREEEWWQFNEKRFHQIYNSASLCLDRCPSRLVGLHEMENAGRSYGFTPAQINFVKEQCKTVEIKWIGYKQISENKPIINDDSELIIKQLTNKLKLEE